MVDELFENANSKNPFPGPEEESNESLISEQKQKQKHSFARWRDFVDQKVLLFIKVIVVQSSPNKLKR
jgi:hypothetical protein